MQISQKTKTFFNFFCSFFFMDFRDKNLNLKLMHCSKEIFSIPFWILSIQHSTEYFDTFDTFLEQKIAHLDQNSLHIHNNLSSFVCSRYLK